jgi:uncharacterized membrane protein
MKKLTAALALGVLVLSSEDSFAWFEICNTKSNGADMYVTYAYYEPSTTTLHTDTCGNGDQVFSPGYFTAWKNTGWWHLNPNQCATVYGPALANTWGYVYASIRDGSSLTGANVPFRVANPPFGIDQYASGPFGCSGEECPVGVGTGYCGTAEWTVNTLPVYQGNYQNFKLNIY